VPARVLPDGVEGQGRHVERDAVEGDGRSLAVSAAQRPGEDRCGEREERHGHQQQRVQEQHDPVGRSDVVEHDVVVGPHLSDEQERDGVGEIGRAELEKAMQQVVVVIWWPDLQHQQGDGDGEDCIAERHQPTGLAVPRG
jgi:hypothetical protein